MSLARLGAIRASRREIRSHRACGRAETRGPRRDARSAPRPVKGRRNSFGSIVVRDGIDFIGARSSGRVPPTPVIRIAGAPTVPGATVSLVEVPETRFVQSGQSYVGYQVLGDGPGDLVYAGTAFTNVDAQWGVPTLAEFLDRIASFSRLILFDKRGVGVSDPVFRASMPTIEDWGDDLNAVLDAAGSERAVLFGSQGGGHGCLLFAATHPERVEGLILHDCYAFGGGLPFEEIGGGDFETWIAYAIEHWPKADGIWAPSDPNLQSLYAQYHRACVSPGILAVLLRVAASVDLRHILGSIRCPTLVLDTNGNLLEGEGKYLSEHIPGASRISLSPGSPADSPEIIDAVAEFVTGARLPVEADSILATILFIDIVDSTGTAAGARRSIVEGPAGALQVNGALRTTPFPRSRGQYPGGRLPRDLRRTSEGDTLRPGDHPSGRRPGLGSEIGPAHGRDPTDWRRCRRHSSTHRSQGLGICRTGRSAGIQCHPAPARRVGPPLHRPRCPRDPGGPGNLAVVCGQVGRLLSRLGLGRMAQRRARSRQGQI